MAIETRAKSIPEWPFDVTKKRHGAYEPINTDDYKWPPEKKERPTAAQETSQSSAEKSPTDSQNKS
jgi:hypothetical protein